MQSALNAAGNAIRTSITAVGQAAVFEKSLQDLVKGIRNIKGDTGPYISKAIQEIKDELKSRDILIKAQALQKMAYLNMLGHDMSWAAFHVIEVMSQERFGLKRIGFLACSQTFTPATDVLVLCTALLKREFGARSPFEVGLAINCLANIATEDLSRDLLSDVVMMLTSSRAYVRKKATLLLYKLYLRYPQGLRLTFDNLKRRLTDETPSVVSCAVNVICELARKKPSNYLSLAPDLFELFTSSTNNWMLIKVAKLMSALVQEEPRLARKLLEPLANIVQTTPAKSLMYECISTITFALQHTKKADGTDAKNAPAVVRLCTDKLREMVREPDQNLKYLGLSGLMNLMVSNPRVVAEHRELVLLCLVDEDVTIRLRALELITGMVTRRNLPDIVTRLVELLEGAEGHWRDELIEKVIFMCSRDKFAYLADFAWYLGVLVKLAYIQGTKHAATVAGQLLDVSVRVEEVRPAAVQALLPMLADAALVTAARVAGGDGGVASIASTGASAAEAAAAVAATTAAAAGGADGEAGAAAASLAGAGALGAGHALFAAAWIVGEFCALIPAEMHGPVIDALLQPSTLTLPAAVQGVYIQSALKLLAAAAAAALEEDDEDADEFVALAASVLARLHPFAQSVHVEVQERACLVQQLLATLGVPFTPLPAGPLSAAAAAAKAEADLMSLASAGAEAPKAAAAPPPPPMAADLKVVSAVLASLFAEPLKPVNPKAQRKVPVPEGLDLDKWFSADEERNAREDEAAAAAAAASKRAGGSGAFKYESISFEDSYGVIADEEEDDDDGPSSKRRVPVGSGADEDDEEWFRDQKKQSKARDAALFGDNDGKKKKGKPILAAIDRLAKERGSDPFMLKKGSSDSGRDAAGSAASIDVDAIPIKKLGAADLAKGSLDISIFKGGAGAAAGKAGKKGKKKAAGSDDDDAPAARPSTKYKIADEEDLPPGAADSDDEPAAGGKKKGKGAASARADALADVDLSTPLRDDEHMPAQAHRSVGGVGVASPGGKGRGRARVLGGGAAAAAAPEAPKEEEKKPKKEKKDKKDKDSKEKKPTAAAAAPAAAAEKPKKKSAGAAEAAPAAAAAAPAAPAAPRVGDAVAAAEPHVYTLGADKALKVTYTVSAAPAAPGAATVEVTVTLRVEPKSSKKAVDWVDAAFGAAEPALPADAAAPAAVLQTAGAAAGAGGAGSLRVATGLKEKAKGKNRAQKATLTFAVATAALGTTLTLPATVTYTVAGAAAATTLSAPLVLRSAGLLVPTAIEAEAYRALMTTEGAAFTHAAATLPAGAAAAGAGGGGKSGEEVIALVCGVLRAYAVARSPRHAILYARTAAGAHVTALLKADDAGTGVSAIVKSVVPGHAAVLLADVTEALKAALAAPAKDDE